MPEIKDLSTWHRLSSDLLTAYPSTTRITTHYTLTPPSSTSKKRKQPSSDTSKEPAAEPTKRARLKVKTHDTASSTTLWFTTNKSAEMSQMMRFLAELGNGMAGKPMKTENKTEPKVKNEPGVEEEIASRTEKKVKEEPAMSVKEEKSTAPASGSKSGQGQQQGGGGGKKKGGKKKK